MSEVRGAHAVKIVKCTRRARTKIVRWRRLRVKMQGRTGPKMKSVRAHGPLNEVRSARSADPK
jgi:hypothetical protein